jgi:pSer/pThr/pTyr-binding forkhead associated (FHA) protein
MSEELSHAERPDGRLVVQGTDEAFPLAEEPVTIGSGADNTIVLTDPEVAALHATIREGDEGEGYRIEDAGSLAGTYVNEQRVEGTMPLREGDVIRLGNTFIELQGEGETAPEAEPVLIDETEQVPPTPTPTPPPSEKATTPWWLIGGIAALAVILCLACFATFSLVFLGDGDGQEVTSEPPVSVATATRAPAEPTATRAPAEPTDTPLPEATETPAPTDVIPPPQIEYFQASPPAINVGGCTTLQWGKVEGADFVTIEPQLGGVGTPDSAQVCPAETTEYILTAEGPGGTTTASVMVEVAPGLPDLTIDSITFDPNPANEGQEGEVAITIRNAGATAAGGFDWQWQAGRDADFDGRIDGLAAGEVRVVTVTWTPGSAYDSLTTEAQVDTAGEIDEEDKRNNRLQADVRVVAAPSQPQTAELKSEASLDGFRTNDGRGSTSDDILVGNGEIIQPGGEVVARGFMSFAVSGIPAGASIESAELRFYQSEVTGDPYSKLGGLVLEHVNYGSRLDDNAFNTPAVDSAKLGDQLPAGQWYILGGPALVSWIQGDVDAGQGRTQMRVRFSIETDGDGEEDWIAIQPGGSFLGSSKAPVLVITYIP